MFEIQNLVDASYHEAKLANAKMRDVTSALDMIQSYSLKQKSIFELWDAIDEQIGQAEAERLQPILITLRNRFETQLISSEINFLEKVFEDSLNTGWKEWLKIIAEAISYFRLQLCYSLCDIAFPFPVKKNKIVEKIRIASKYMLYGRWSEAYDQIKYLAELDLLPKKTRANLFVIAGEIQLYNYLKSKKAKKLFEEAEKLEPKEARVILGLGQYWLEEKEFEKAQKYFKRAIRMNPGLALCYTKMGEIYERQKKFTIAEKWYKQAITLASGYTSGYIQLYTLYGLHKFNTHKELLPNLIERAIAVGPEGEFQRYLEVGSIYQRNSLFKDAHNWYEKAIKLDKNEIGGYLFKGNCYKEERSRN